MIAGEIKVSSSKHVDFPRLERYLHLLEGPHQEEVVINSIEYQNGGSFYYLFIFRPQQFHSTREFAGTYRSPELALQSAAAILSSNNFTGAVASARANNLGTRAIESIEAGIGHQTKGALERLLIKHLVDIKMTDTNISHISLEFIKSVSVTFLNEQTGELALYIMVPQEWPRKAFVGYFKSEKEYMDAARDILSNKNLKLDDAITAFHYKQRNTRCE